MKRYNKENNTSYGLTSLPTEYAVGCSNKKESDDVINELWNRKSLFGWKFVSSVRYGLGRFFNNIENYPHPIIKYKDWKRLYYKEESEIAGYKAPFDMVGLDDYISKGEIFSCKHGESYYYNDSFDGTSRKNPIPKEIVETWNPVYKPKLRLPEINGYKGELSNDNILVTYGCAKFNVSKFKKVLSIQELSLNRSIKSITLDSGVTITIEQIKQIVKYVESVK